VQCAILNMPMEERFSTNSILLPVLAKAKVYKKHGMSRVINGVDEHGVQHDEPNHGADMRELDSGRWIELPDDDNGGTLRWYRLRVWHVMFSGDYLGSQSVTPCVESPSAHVFCRACDYDSRSPMADRPFSFLRRPPAAADGKRPKPAFAERDCPTLKQELNRLRAGVSATELKQVYHDLGLNKLQFALDPDYLPHVTPTTVAPGDVLHLFPDGLLRSELAWCMYIMFKLGLDLDRVNERLRAFKGLPKDVRIPLFPAKLKQGTDGGRPVSKSVVRMTGSQCMHFSLHRCATCVHSLACIPLRDAFPCVHSLACRSVEILQPLLTRQMQGHPAWISWLKLVELFSVVIQHELTVADVEHVDNLVLEHSRLFDEVPEYNGLKRPKHHLICHLAGDIWRYGPPRGYWCFGFEGFNKVIKQAAHMSNWRNTTLSILRYWSGRSARHLVKCCE
jgi:hypothetical protein